eukprot:symbB.v1.2.019926.t1/scaffold1652.1/size121070/6
MVLFLLGLVPELLPQGNLAARRKELLSKQRAQQASEEISEDVVHVAADATDAPPPLEDAVHVDNDGRGNSLEETVRRSSTTDEDLVRVGEMDTATKERPQQPTTEEDKDLVRVGDEPEAAKEHPPQAATEEDKDLVRVGDETAAKEAPPNPDDKDLVSVGLETVSAKERSPVSTSLEATQELGETKMEVASAPGEVREPTTKVPVEPTPVVQSEPHVEAAESRDTPASVPPTADMAMSFDRVQELPTRPPEPAADAPIPTERPEGMTQQASSDVHVESGEVASTAAPLTPAKQASDGGAEVRVEAGSSAAETSESPAATAEIPKQASDVHVESGEVASTAAPLTPAKQASDGGAEVRVEAGSSAAETSESPAATAEIPKQASDVHVESGEVASTAAPLTPAKQVPSGGDVTVEGLSQRSDLPPQASDVQVDSNADERKATQVGLLQKLETAAVSAGEGLLRAEAATDGVKAIEEVASVAAAEVGQVGQALAKAAEKTEEALSSEVVAIKQSLS